MAESYDRDRPTVGSMSWVTKLAFAWGGELVSVLTSSILQMGFVWHITLTTNSASMLSLASLAGFCRSRSSAPSRGPLSTACRSSVRSSAPISSLPR